MSSLEHEIISLFQQRIEALTSKFNDNYTSIVVPSGDDASVIKFSKKQTVLSNDALVAGTHFLPGANPEYIGQKLLAVSLSDLSAMGATPHSVLLSLVLPDADLCWVDKFCDGFFVVAEKYGVTLLGGNVSKGPMSLHATVVGTLAEEQQPLLQSGAKKGDYIFVCGKLGSAAYALQQMLLGDYGLESDFWNVQPYFAIGQAMLDKAHACIDISDGLHSDLQRLIDFGSLGAVLELNKLPMADSLSDLDLAQAYSYALYGGEDYGLCFAVPPEYHDFACSINGMACIGRFTREVNGIICVDHAGVEHNIKNISWQHFAEEE